MGSAIDLHVTNDGHLSTAAHNPSGHIIFNTQQQSAIEKMVKWYNSTGCTDPFILQGYAGTGKTTLVREVMGLMPVHIGKIALVAPTNRAAKVLANKTGLHTQTIHKLIYLTVREELDFQRERLHMWDSSTSFTQISDLIILSNETDLGELFFEETGSDPKSDPRFQAWLQNHRVTVLQFEGLTLPDDAYVRQEYYDKTREDKIKEHKQNIRKLLDEPLNTRKKSPEEIIEKYDLIIVDESSMVNADIGRDLVSYDVPVIFVGDPFQLEPVKAKPYWDKMKPSAVLTKIERQKGPGAGIPLAGERIRNGDDIEANDSLQIVRRGVTPNEVFMAADQILCGTHKTRERVCDTVRRMNGWSGDVPQIGEKVVAVYNDKKVGIMNGEIYTVTGSKVLNDQACVLDLVDPYDKKIAGIAAWRKGFQGRSNTDFLPDSYGKFWWGYCITTHQSQGSEWKNTIVCDDWPGDKHDRWLYTAVTRASVGCILIRG